MRLAGCCMIVLFLLLPSGMADEASLKGTEAKIIRELHAVPPVGWRRTNRGWEHFAEVSPPCIGGNVKNETWIGTTTAVVRTVPPPLVALSMLAGVLLPLACRAIFRENCGKYAG